MDSGRRDLALSSCSFDTSMYSCSLSFIAAAICANTSRAFFAPYIHEPGRLGHIIIQPWCLSYSAGILKLSKDGVVVKIFISILISWQLCCEEAKKNPYRRLFFCPINYNLLLKSSYPKCLITLQFPSGFITAISGRGIPLNVLFFTME